MKISSCLLASGFIFASIYSMIISKYNQKTIKFIGSLDSVEQLEMYNRVKSERLIIYLQGQILGMIIGLFYLFYFKNNSRYSYCYFSLITYVITVIYYLLKNKQYKMNDHLKTDEQRKLLEESNESMKTTYIFGFILGLIGYIVLARILYRFLNKSPSQIISINR
jgi:hypothetical protein